MVSQEKCFKLGKDVFFLYSRMARLFRKNFIEAQIDVPNEFCDKVYGGWDFAISSNAKFKHEELQTQLIVSSNKLPNMQINTFVHIASDLVIATKEK